MKTITRILSIVLFAMIARAEAQEIIVRPVFQTNTACPTRDKPQSKLWFDKQSWWALLPTQTGASLWQRSSTGHWQEREELRDELTGIPGRADVWFDQDGATAVGVEDHRLTVFRISDNEEVKGAKTVSILGALPLPTDNITIETATLVRGQDKKWWVAADFGTKMLVWSSDDGKHWSSPYPVAEGMAEDDIGTLTTVGTSVLLIWSDQAHDAVFCRIHQDGQALQNWQSMETVESGNRTADDHLHAAVLPDGTIVLATKNSVDQQGKPQLVLRMRTVTGAWVNKPYALNEGRYVPSRPVVIATQKGKVYAAHTIYDEMERTEGSIVFSAVDLSRHQILLDKVKSIRPDSSLKSRINDVTTAKQYYPDRGDRIMLASDEEGRVFELAF